METVTDAAWMAEAIRLAERGSYTTHPNPCVGAVIVNQGNVVGRGFHLRHGEGHAEANALAEAGEAARGACVYCTLEPCSFHGRTPSCAKSLIDAGVSRVVVGMVDPDPRNAGAGLAMLRDSGVDVVCPMMEASVRALNPGHIKRHEKGVPYIRLKLGMSLDGKTALSNGESKWITGKAARRDVQKLRARSSAVITGVQTVIDDDPAMTVRANELEAEFAELAATVPRRIVVLDPRLRINRNAQILKNPNTLLVCLEASSADPDIKCEKMRLPSDGHNRIALPALLSRLADLECNEVLFECGATLAASVLDGGLADELVVYIAPAALGADARSLLNLAKIDSMKDRIEFKVADVRHIGEDIRMICIPSPRN